MDTPPEKFSSQPPHTPAENAPAPAAIGVFISEHDSVYLNRLLEEVGAACWIAKLSRRVYRTRQGVRAADCLRRIQGSPAEERVIILGQPQETAREMASALTSQGYQSVIVDTLVPGAPCSSITVDNALTIRIGMDHLMSLGHRRILLLVNEPEEAETVRLRIREFQAVVKERGLDERQEFYCGTQFWQDPYETTYRRMPELWGGGAPYTALFAVSDIGACAALQWFSENGVSVPERISVLGLGDDAPADCAQLSLSTLGFPIARMAHCAVETLLAGVHAQIAAPSVLIVRQSTGAPRAI